MFKLVYPEYSMFYLFIPVAILFFVAMRYWRRRALHKFATSAIAERLTTGISGTKPVVRFILLLLAFSSLTLAVMRPQVGSKIEEVKREGVDVMIALDVSNSMNAEDIKPSRLQRARQAIYRLIDKLEGDRIGLIVFAGQAYVQLPITTDYAAAKLFLSTVSTDMVPSQGTAIGAAIEKAVESIGDSARHNSAIIVITDGENHEDDPVAAAQQAAEKGIVVHAIGMGSNEGAPIPVYRGGRNVGFLENREGTTVISKLDQFILQDMCDAGNGKFVRATNSDDGLAMIMEQVKAMDKQEFASKLFTDYDDQFQYFLALTLILLIAEQMISDRRSRLIRKLNLFGEKETSKSS
jgi:Ca-activated chloride channel family protein